MNISFNKIVKTMFVKDDCAIYIEKNLKVYVCSTVLFVLWLKASSYRTNNHWNSYSLYFSGIHKKQVSFRGPTLLRSNTTQRRVRRDRIDKIFLGGKVNTYQGYLYNLQIQRPLNFGKTNRKIKSKERRLLINISRFGTLFWIFFLLLPPPLSLSFSPTI